MKLKRLLIVLVAIVVVVCIGATTYYFLRNDEIINFEKTTLQLNQDDYFTLKGQGYNGLGLTVKKPARSTKFGYKVYDLEGNDITEAGEYIVYNAESDAYLAKKGGEVVFEITTTNNRYPSYKVNIHIGNGEVSNPYYVRTTADFEKIAEHPEKSYVLCNDITVTSGLNCELTGNFDGNGHSILGLNIGNEQAGLFKKISGTSVVKDLTLRDVTINGSFETVGALAGEVSGSAKISGVQVENCNITNLSNTGVTGGLIGKTTGENVTVVLCSVHASENGGANITLGSAARAEGGVTAGGLIGIVNKSTVKGSYANVKINNNLTGNVAGLAGQFIVAAGDADARTNCKGSIQQSYAVVEGNATAFIGTMTTDGEVSAENTAFYKFLVGNYAQVKDNSAAALIGSFGNTTIEGMINTINENPAAVAVQTITKTDKDYIYYKTTKWDASVWNLSATPYPTLKVGGDKQLDENSLSIVPQSYLVQDKTATIIQDGDNVEQVITELKAALNSDQEGIVVEAESDLDLTDYTAIGFTNRSISGVEKDGKYPTIIVNNQLFKTLDNATVENLNIVVKEVSVETEIYGGVASIATNSTINNVTVRFDADINNSSILTFGGIVGTATSTDIENCSATNIKVIDSAIRILGGIAGTSDRRIVVKNSKVEIASFTSSAIANVGGIVGLSSANITAISGEEKLDADNKTEVKISINNVINSTRVAGITVENKGTISNVRLTGSINYLNNMTATTINIAGVAVDNQNSISRVYNELTNIGTAVVAGKDYHVAGIAIKNSNENSVINECTVRSDVYGNYSYGIVEEINHGSAHINSVYVAGVDGANKIAGDKRVAGLIDRLTLGRVANIQTNSIVEGTANNSLVSLMVFEFPNGAFFKNAAIKNQFAGFGTFFRDTDRVTRRTVNRVTVEGYNLYGAPGNSGSMQSVVMDIEYARTNITNYKTARFIQSWFFGVQTTYENNATSSYIREVRSDEYLASAMFNGTFTLTTDSSITDNHRGNVNYTKTLTFLTPSVWDGAEYSWANGAWKDSGSTIDCGVKLAFLDD